MRSFTTKGKQAFEQDLMTRGLHQDFLLEAAGTKVAKAAMSYDAFLFLIGPGLNGGDGLIAARHLAAFGKTVHAFTFGTAKGRLRLAAETSFQSVGGILEVLSEEKVVELLPQVDLVVDALFGLGYRTPIPDLLEKIAQVISATAKPVLAVDMPTGLSANSGFVASKTVTFFAPTQEHLLFRDRLGCLEIGSLGVPPYWSEAADGASYFANHQEAAKLLPTLAANSHKGDRGKVGLWAGSAGFTGAAHLAALGALFSGAGLVWVASTKDALARLPHSSMGLDLSGFTKKVQEQGFSAIGIGPGIGFLHAEPFFHLWQKNNVPLVVDADGLTLLAQKPEWWQSLLHRDVVLTPHSGEFSRLTGLSIQEIESDRLNLAQVWAKKWGVTLLLKGHATVVASPDGRIHINQTGNAVLAMGGTGDILTGLLTGLLAQGLNTYDAARLAAHVHGLAGDLLREERGLRGSSSRTLADYLGPAFLRMQEV